MPRHSRPIMSSPLDNLDSLLDEVWDVSRARPAVIGLADLVNRLHSAADSFNAARIVGNNEHLPMVELYKYTQAFVSMTSIYLLSFSLLSPRIIPYSWTTPTVIPLVQCTARSPQIIT
jgi:hypothetical protein